MINNLSRRDFLKTTGAMAAVAATSGIVSSFSSNQNEVDILIKNGLIIDGTGSIGFSGSIGITGDTITDIGNLGVITAKKIIDAGGTVIAPGFVNIHCHTYGGIINQPGFSSVMQGITTELGGLCGDSTGPTRNGKNIGDYLDEMSKEKLGINFATLVGHGTIRSLVVGQEGREPTADELKKMKALVEEAVQGGAFGLSTGLEYTPGTFAKLPELIELSKPLKKYGLQYASHMRNEDFFLLDAIQETLTIGREAECPVEISHLKVQGKPNWGNIDRVLEMIEKASQEHGNVNFDCYPYTAYATGLSNLFPTWSREGGTARFRERLQDKKSAEEIKDYVIKKVESLGSWNSVMITSARGENRKYGGMRMDDIARDKGTDPYDETVAMMLSGGADTVCFGMSEENTKRILAHPLCMICTDGSAQAKGAGIVHPRNFGAFARVLGQYTRDEKICDLQDAIHKMTGLPAGKIGLKKRGILKKGNYADIVIFDPKTVNDTATYQNPKEYPTGISHIIINGKIAVENGEHTGALAGQVLRFEP